MFQNQHESYQLFKKLIFPSTIIVIIFVEDFAVKEKDKQQNSKQTAMKRQLFTGRLAMFSSRRLLILHNLHPVGEIVLQAVCIVPLIIPEHPSPQRFSLYPFLVRSQLPQVFGIADLISITLILPFSDCFKNGIIHQSAFRHCQSLSNMCDNITVQRKEVCFSSQRCRV